MPGGHLVDCVWAAWVIAAQPTSRTGGACVVSAAAAPVLTLPRASVRCRGRLAALLVTGIVMNLRSTVIDPKEAALVPTSKPRSAAGAA
jgi:hypothetical protein